MKIEISLSLNIGPDVYILYAVVVGTRWNHKMLIRVRLYIYQFNEQPFELHGDIWFIIKNSEISVAKGKDFNKLDSEYHHAHLLTISE